MWLTWWWRYVESRTLTRRWIWLRRLSQTPHYNQRDRWNRSRRMDRHCCTSRYWCTPDQSILEPSCSGTALKYIITGLAISAVVAQCLHSEWVITVLRHYQHIRHIPRATKSNPLKVFAVFSATVGNFSSKFYVFMWISYLHLLPSRI